MLTGVIQPLLRTRQLDRSDVEYPLWEQSPKPNACDLPWSTASSFDMSAVRNLLSGAKTVVVASARSSMYDHILSVLPARTRVYAYGPQSMESDRRLVLDLSKASGQVAVRLGHELPADWIVVDGGRAGVLLVGPPGEQR